MSMIPVSPRRRGVWPLALGAATLVAAAYLVMQEVDSLLLTLESAGQQRFGMSALFSLRGDAETAKNALTHWELTARGERPFEFFNPFVWVRIHAMCDTVFAAGYASAIGLMLVRLWRSSWWWLLAGLVFAADACENVATFVLAGQSEVRAHERFLSGAEFRTPGLADHLYKFGIAKWILFGAAVIVIAAGVVHRWLILSNPAEPQCTWRSVLWGLRVQIAAVGLLAFAVAVPTKDRLGALQQVPDVIRSFFPLGESDVRHLVVGSLCVLGVSVAVWVTAHWLPFAPASPQTASPDRSSRPVPWFYPSIVALAGLWLVAGLVQLWGGSNALTSIGVSTVPPWARPWQAALPAFVGFLLLGAVLGLYWFSGRGKTPKQPPPWHMRRARVTQLLTVLPIAIGGLGLVRAAVGMALLPSAGVAGAAWVIAGAVVAVLVAPVLLGFLGLVLRAELPGEDGSTGEDVAEARPATVPVAVTVAILVLAGGLSVALGGWPDKVGPWFGALGVLAIALAAGTVALGGILAVTSRAEPLLVDRKTATVDRVYQTPGLALVVVLASAFTLADNIGTYHDLQYLPTAPAPGATLADHFQSWQKAMDPCQPAATTGQRIQPFVIVTAAGGGIRAAYWTEKALLQLTGTDTAEPGMTVRCRRDAVFMVSGASGGSVGAALWGLHDLTAPRSAPAFTTAIADQDALASVGAAWFFRDAARGLSGLNFGWPDRAAVMERSWTRSLSRQRVDVSRPFLAEPTAWSPLLLLNGTDLQTGCRVVIAPIGLADPGDLPRQCAEAGPRGTDMPGAYYAPEFLDTARCSGAGPRDISVATAALLSARFPYVTPTGLMYACANDSKSIVRIQIGDGGYLESTGLHAALQVWRAIEPLVAEHNRSVLDPDREPSFLKDSLILPVLVEIGNGYRSVAAAAAPSRQNELIAPIAGIDLAGTAIAASRLEAEARAEFSRPVPGTNLQLPGLDVRLVNIAPTSRPEVTAPLGWSLSTPTLAAMDAQMNEQIRDGTLLTFLRGLMVGGTLADRLALAPTSGQNP